MKPQSLLRLGVYLSSLAVIGLFFTPEVYATLTINEISPVTSPEWVEIYNDSNESQNLEGWMVSDDEQPESGHFAIIITQVVQDPVIPAHGFLVVKGPTDSYSRLANGGDKVLLYDDQNIEKDSYTYGSTTNGKTYSRIPDGNSNWVANTDPTEGVNNQPLPTPTSPPQPTSTPTPSPTPSATPKPTPTPTKKPTSTPTPSPTVAPESSSSANSYPNLPTITPILGATSQPIATSTQLPLPHSRSSLIAAALIGLGAIILTITAGIYLNNHYFKKLSDAKMTRHEDS